MGIADAVLFPRFCLGCGVEGDSCCPRCARALGALAQTTPAVHSCPRCGSMTSWGRFCDRCKKTAAFQGLLYAGSYANAMMRAMIWALKFGGDQELAHPLGALLADVLNGFPALEFNDDCVIVPVPLCRQRLRERGFNQAECIGRVVADRVGIEFCADMLHRVRSTSPQMMLSGEKRSGNIAGVFAINESKRAQLPGKTVILVDDVATTGSTLNECARVLMDAGALRIWALVVAKD